MPKRKIDALTPREMEVLTQVAEGKSLVEIAHQLHRSLKTIESHRLSLGKKLKATNRVQLTKFAIAHGLVRIDIADTTKDGQDSEKRLLRVINELNEALGTSTDLALLERFVVAASTLDNIRFATVYTPLSTRHISEIQPLERMVVAIAEYGELRELSKFQANKTPFTEVFEHGQCLITEGIREKYPDDSFMNSIKAESFLGIQLVNNEDRVVGGIGLIGCEPLSDPNTKYSAIKFFAPRLAGALENSIQIKALRTRLKQLETQVNEPISSPYLNLANDDPKLSLTVAHVMQRIEDHAGGAFLRKIVDVFCETFDLHHAGICRLDALEGKQFLQSVICRVDGEFDKNILYEIVDTPCYFAIQHGEYHVAHSADKAFSSDDKLVSNAVEAYVGVRLPSPDGQTAGIFWLGSGEKIENAELIMRVANFFAPRIGAELDSQTQLEHAMQAKEASETEAEQA